MPDGRTWTHTGSLGTDPGAHAVEFSKTAAPSREGDSFANGAPEGNPARGRTGEYSADLVARGPRSGANPTGRGRIARRTRNGSAAAPIARCDPGRGARSGQDRHRDREDAE